MDINDNRAVEEEDIKKDAKVRSIRIDDDTLEKFKNITKSFPNANECLSRMISTYELVNAENMEKGLSETITDFQTHITSLQNLFLYIIDMKRNTEERVRQEFSAQMLSKDNIIISLQTIAEEEKEKRETGEKKAEEQIDTLTAERDRLRTELAATKGHVEVLQSTISSNSDIIKDKDTIINALNSRLIDQEEFDSQLQVKDDEIQELKQQLDESHDHENDLALEISSLQFSIDTIEKTNKQEQEIIKKDYELKIQQAVLKERERLQDKLEEYNSKIMQLQEIILNLSRKEEKTE